MRHICVNGLRIFETLLFIAVKFYMDTQLLNDVQTDIATQKLWHTIPLVSMLLLFILMYVYIRFTCNMEPIISSLSKIWHLDHEYCPLGAPAI